MERCVLCGGKLSGGRCVECGLDNTKNDKKYHLNVHNEKSVKFHPGKCEDHVNQEAGKKSRRTVPNQKVQKKENFFEEAETRKQSAKQTKKATQRRQAGTVKKKSTVSRIAGWVVIAIVVVEIINALLELLPSVLDELETWSLGEEIGGWNLAEDFDEEEQVAEIVQKKPERIDWDQNADGYFELNMRPGIYTVGYEIPAGEYQIYCEEGYATVRWQNAEEIYENYLMLSSPAVQEEDPYLAEIGVYELSERMVLLEGATVMVEDCSNDVRLVPSY